MKSQRAKGNELGLIRFNEILAILQKLEGKKLAKILSEKSLKYKRESEQWENILIQLNGIPVIMRSFCWSTTRVSFNVPVKDHFCILFKKSLLFLLKTFPKIRRIEVWCLVAPAPNDTAP